jgi:hypothetical protein
VRFLNTLELFGVPTSVWVEFLGEGFIGSANIVHRSIP